MSRNSKKPKTLFRICTETIIEKAAELATKLMCRALKWNWRKREGFKPQSFKAPLGRVYISHQLDLIYIHKETFPVVRPTIFTPVSSSLVSFIFIPHFRQIRMPLCYTGFTLFGNFGSFQQQHKEALDETRRERDDCCRLSSGSVIQFEINYRERHALVCREFLTEEVIGFIWRFVPMSRDGAGGKRGAGAEFSLQFNSVGRKVNLFSAHLFRKTATVL